MNHDLRTEVDRNYDFFQRNLGSYLKTNGGQYALLRSAEIISFHNTAGEAYRAGLSSYPDEIFSVQEVTDQPVDLGFMSLAFS
jgi:hypothetical protein